MRYGRHGEVCERENGTTMMTIRPDPEVLSFEQTVALVMYGCAPFTNNNFYDELKMIGRQALRKKYWVNRLKHYCSYLNIDDEEMATYDYWCDNEFYENPRNITNRKIWSDIEDHLKMVIPEWDDAPSLIKGEEE